MNICWISQALPYLPCRGGFRLYGGNLIKHLSKRHRIDLVTLLGEDDEDYLDWCRQYCASVHTIPTDNLSAPLRVAHSICTHLAGIPLRHRARLRRLLAKLYATCRWDVVHVEGSYMGGITPGSLPVPRVLSLHDSWTLRAREMLQCAQSLQETLFYTLTRYCEPRYERLVYPKYDAVTVVAGPDLEEVRRTVPSANVVLIPYGTDLEYFRPLEVEKETKCLVFHSHLGYAPNIEAALEFANEIFPIIRKKVPDAVLHLVGANPGPMVQELASRPGIRISANLPDLRPTVCSAGIYVCPIRHGTGLKSKMLEAMAMGMPIVAYHPGSTVGIECAHGEHLLAAETPLQFAAHVLDLLSNPRKAQKLAAAARKLVEEKYSWDSRAQAYEQLYAELIEERRSRSEAYSFQEVRATSMAGR